MPGAAVSQPESARNVGSNCAFVANGWDARLWCGLVVNAGVFFDVVARNRGDVVSPLAGRDSVWPRMTRSALQSELSVFQISCSSVLSVSVFIDSAADLLHAWFFTGVLLAP